MFEVIESMNQVYTAGISPSLAKEVAKKVKAETYLSGSFQGRENTYWIMVNLVNTESGKIIWTNKIEGNLKSSGYLVLADSLCNEIKNYLEIKALQDIADYEFREAYPKSAEAYRYFIEGMNYVLNQNYESGIQSLKKALEIDSTFTLASFYIAYAYTYNYQWEPSVLWTKKTYLHKDRVPPKYKLWLELWYACYESKNLQDISRYCDLLAESGINTRLLWSDLGVTYVDFLQQFEKAIAAFEKVIEINLERGSDWKFITFWDQFLKALHKAGSHEREKEISDIGLSAIPNSSNWIYYRMAVCALSQGKIAEANEVLVKYRAKHKELGTSESSLELFLGQMYEEANIMDQAEMHFRKAYELSPQRIGWNQELARFLIYHDINVDEGMEIISKGLQNWPENEYFLQLKGWGLYKQAKYEESVQLLSIMWDKSIGFNTELYNHLNEARQALANQNKIQ
jgi:tetratricopeptide (TPR) repeat protein